VAEVALAFVLAIGAAMVFREIDRLRRIPVGMDTTNAVALHLTPRASANDYHAIASRVMQLPGVQSAGFIQLVPLQNRGWEADFAIRGRPPEPPGRLPIAALRYVTPGYFATLGIPVVKGRGFGDGDHEKAPRVILVNEALANRYFAGEDPVGRETTRGTNDGVVGDVRNVAIGRPADPELYYPAAQNVTMASDIGMSLIVRAAGAPLALVESVRAAVREVNPALAVFNVRTMDQVVVDSLWELHLYRWVVGLFALLALALAVIGLYGVTAYAAGARTREFAIRMALGSDQRSLVGTVLWRGLLTTVIGLLVGAAGMFAAVGLLGRLGVGRADAAAYLIVSALLIVLSLLAAAIPALRVAALNPVSALRQD
jgi:putative ABC transport system permease protein